MSLKILSLFVTSYCLATATVKTYMEEVSTNYKDNSKKFWSYIKTKGQELTGVAPLKNKLGFLQSDNKSKSEILNDQFHAVSIHKRKSK